MRYWTCTTGPWRKDTLRDSCALWSLHFESREFRASYVTDILAGGRPPAKGASFFLSLLTLTAKTEISALTIQYLSYCSRSCKANSGIRPVVSAQRNDIEGRHTLSRSG